MWPLYASVSSSEKCYHPPAHLFRPCRVVVRGHGRGQGHTLLSQRADTPLSGQLPDIPVLGTFCFILQNSSQFDFGFPWRPGPGRVFPQSRVYSGALSGNVGGGDWTSSLNPKMGTLVRQSLDGPLGRGGSLLSQEDRKKTTGRRFNAQPPLV